MTMRDHSKCQSAGSYFYNYQSLRDITFELLLFSSFRIYGICFFYQDQGGTQFLTIVWRYKAQPPEHLSLLYSFSDDIPRDPSREGHLKTICGNIFIKKN